MAIKRRPGWAGLAGSGLAGAGFAAVAGYAAAWAQARGQLARARQAAQRDALTGLTNRAGLTTRGARLLAGAGRRGVPVGVVVLDLVGFKQVNDTHGHPAGDAVLVAVAHRLAAAAGRGAVVARSSGGGDEFAVLLSPPGTLAAGSTQDSSAIDGQGWLGEWMNRAHESLCLPVTFDGRLVAVGASLGGVLAGPGEGLSLALARADAAMYIARAKALDTFFDTTPVVPVPQPRPAVRLRDTTPRGAATHRARTAGALGWATGRGLAAGGGR